MDQINHLSVLQGDLENKQKRNELESDYSQLNIPKYRQRSKNVSLLGTETSRQPEHIYHWNNSVGCSHSKSYTSTSVRKELHRVQSRFRMKIGS